MRHIFTLLLFSANITLSAQTKKIAFKSHSGSDEHFAIALENNLFDMEGSDFGAAPVRQVTSSQLDSVIYISKDEIYMVTSVYCKERYSREKNDTSLWYPGRRNVNGHPLFSKKHSLDSIKKVVRDHYYFNNPVEKVVFIGFDNGIEYDTMYDDYEPITAKGGNTGGTLVDTQIIIILGAILFISLISGWLARRLNRIEGVKDIA